MFKLSGLLGFVILLSGVAASQAADRTWTGAAGDRNWFNAANWSPADSVPLAGESATLATGTIILSNSTPALNTVTLTNAVLVFTNWDTTLTAADVTVWNAGVISNPPPFTDSQMSNRVHIVCTNFILNKGGRIALQGCGYRGGSTITENGNGPGKGLISSTHFGGGAGHGGRGGNGSSGRRGTEYDSTNSPTSPGSGGGGGGPAGDGGGAVRIAAALDVTIEGTINADGSRVRYYGGSGSGGSIYITCRTFNGSSNGLLTANGANGPDVSGSGGGGGGGGGRIAVVYDPAFQSAAPRPLVRFSVAKGVRIDTRPGIMDGFIGSVYLPDTLLLSGTLPNFLNVRLFGVTNWAPDSLALTNRTIWFGEDGFRLTTTNGILCATNSELVFWKYCDLNCGGDLVLTNGGSLVVYGGLTSSAAVSWGARVSVTGALVVAPNSWVYPGSVPESDPSLVAPMVTNNAAGSPLFRAGRLVVAPGAGFNANGSGFSGGGAPITDNGFGPGRGTVTTYYGGGGGHGGRGANGSNGTGGSPYDRTNMPIQPGSGGGGPQGAAGGGVIRIEALGDVSLGGTLTANALSGLATTYSGGGGGGSIMLMCRGLGMATSAVLSAKGGNPGALTAGTGGAGGGGRIAVALGLDDATRQNLADGQAIAGLREFGGYSPRSALITATGGVGKTSVYNGTNGTVVFLTTNFTLRVTGTPQDIGLPAPQLYGTLPYAGADAWVTNSVASPVLAGSGLGWACLGWSLASAAGPEISSGATTNAVVQLTNNLVLTWAWTNLYQFNLVSSSVSNGSVNGSALNGWYTNGTTVAGIEAVASNGYDFSLWTGDVPAGHETDNPLSVDMTQPRSLAAVFISASGGTKTWSGNGAWESNTNWQPNGMPGVYDDVVLATGRVVFGNARRVSSLTISNGATLMFTNWAAMLTASGVTVRAGGRVTLAPAFTDSQMSNRVYFVCTNFLLESGAVIAADGLGFAGSVTASGEGNGPGKGRLAVDSSYYGGGAGHGGAGGAGMAGPGGAVNDSIPEPGQPGSGGAGSLAGSGGGAVRIEAVQRATIDGTIAANGMDPASYGGAGSGGAIFISCTELVGGGLLSANGGNSFFSAMGSGGGGGGGRVAVSYDVAAQANLPAQGLRFSTAPGACGVTALPGDAGSVWLPDTLFLSESMENFADVRIHGITNWTGDSLILSNRIVRFAESGFALSLSNGVDCGAGGGLVLPEQAVLQAGGGLSLTNGGFLTLYGGATGEATSACGALADFGGDASLAPGSWVYAVGNRTNPAAGVPLFRMRNLSIATNAGFSASGRGFAGGAERSESGYGPGAGLCVLNGYYGGGAGHGGAGGAGTAGAGGAAYGRTNAPVTAGSGGGGANAGAGGGALWIEAAGIVSLNGTISADAASGTGYGGGGGGGAIFLACARFRGDATASLLARGGNAGPSSQASAGGGGGGRIAVWSGAFDPADRAMLMADGTPRRVVLAGFHPAFAGIVSTTNGINPSFPARNGLPGTAVFVFAPPPAGAVIVLY
jgi:hypothetical protein